MALDDEEAALNRTNENDVFAGGDAPDDISAEIEELERLAEEERLAADSAAAEEQAAKDEADATAAALAAEEAAAAEAAKEKTPEELEAEALAAAAGEEKTPEEIASEAAAAETAAAEAAKADRDSGVMIPKTRLDAKTKQIEALERQIAELSGDQPTTVNANMAVDLEGALTDPSEMFDAIIDGEVDHAGKLFKDAMSAVASATAQQVADVMDIKVKDGQELNTQQGLFDSAVDKAFEAYPVLDPESDSFDEVASRAITAYQQSLVTGGEALPHDAVAQAVKELMPAFGGVANPGGKPPPEKTPNEGKADAAKERQRAALKKKLADLEEQQPPDTTSSAADGTEAVNMENITIEEFEALPESMQRKLQGDFM